jgi:hypothetical protein
LCFDAVGERVRGIVRDSGRVAMDRENRVHVFRTRSPKQRPVGEEITGVAHSSRLAAPAFGERQYAAADPAGHRWVFTQSIADVAPKDWGGLTVDPW